MIYKPVSYFINEEKGIDNEVSTTTIISGMFTLDSLFELSPFPLSLKGTLKEIKNTPFFSPHTIDLRCSNRFKL